MSRCSWCGENTYANAPCGCDAHPSFTYADKIREIEHELDWFEQQREKCGPVVEIDPTACAMPHRPREVTLILDEKKNIGSGLLQLGVHALFVGGESLPIDRVHLCVLEGEIRATVASAREFNELVQKWSE